MNAITGAICAAVSLLSVSSASVAQTALTMGAGESTCAEFGQHYQRAVDIEGTYFDWAQGYMSGMNTMFALLKRPTRDLHAMPTSEQMTALRHYCDDHPLEEYEAAVVSLYYSLPDVPVPNATKP